jgi:hypothetical protein
MIRVIPSPVSQQLLPRQQVSAKEMMDHLVPVALTDASLTNVVNACDLYPSRSHQAAEDLVERLRHSLHVEPVRESAFRLSFSYGEIFGGEETAKKAQKVVQWLVSALIDQQIRNESGAAFEAKQFFEDMTEAAGKELAKAEAKLRATPASDVQYSAVSLDRDASRKQYEAIALKHAEVKVLQQLRERKMDQNLELLDPATLPEEPDTSPWFPRIAGLMAGLAAWLLIECRPGPRVGAQMDTSQESEVSVREG